MPPFPIALKCVYSDFVMVASEGNDLNLSLAKKLVQQNSRIFSHPRREHQRRLYQSRSACCYHLGLRDEPEQVFAAGFS